MHERLTLQQPQPPRSLIGGLESSSLLCLRNTSRFSMIMEYSAMYLVGSLVGMGYALCSLRYHNLYVYLAALQTLMKRSQDCLWCRDGDEWRCNHRFWADTVHVQRERSLQPECLLWHIASIRCIYSTVTVSWHPCPLCCRHLSCCLCRNMIRNYLLPLLHHRPRQNSPLHHHQTHGPTWREFQSPLQ